MLIVVIIAVLSIVVIIAILLIVVIIAILSIVVIKAICIVQPRPRDLASEGSYSPFSTPL